MESLMTLKRMLNRKLASYSSSSWSAAAGRLQEEAGGWESSPAVPPSGWDQLRQQLPPRHSEHDELPPASSAGLRGISSSRSSCLGTRRLHTPPGRQRP